MSDSRFRTPYKLPVRHITEGGTHIENEFLFGVYEELFTKKYSGAVAQYYMEAHKKRYPNHIHPWVKQTEISHDQLTAYSSYSYGIGQVGHIYIWANIDGLKYDGRTLHPRDWIYYNLLNHSLKAILLLPLFYIFCAASLFIGYRWNKGKFEKKLSGELLWILRYEILKEFWWAKPLKWIIKAGAKMRFGSVYDMVATYFYNDLSHPIIKRWRYDI